ncbi:MAG: hypothetical protein K0R05_4010 [Anaerocolumna sp.]|nr:hypothetical protein [Anaerocolumna sp.]
MKKIKGFIKSEAVLLISAFAALLTMFFVPPSIDYISYIDFYLSEKYYPLGVCIHREFPFSGELPVIFVYN